MALIRSVAVDLWGAGAAPLGFATVVAGGLAVGLTARLVAAVVAGAGPAMTSAVMPSAGARKRRAFIVRARKGDGVGSIDGQDTKCAVVLLLT